MSSLDAKEENAEQMYVQDKGIMNEVGKTNILAEKKRKKAQMKSERQKPTKRECKKMPKGGIEKGKSEILCHRCMNHRRPMKKKQGMCAQNKQNNGYISNTTRTEARAQRAYLALRLANASGLCGLPPMPTKSLLS
jgi:hypothetical protein